MYKSREVRWFFKEENKQLSDWFNSKGLYFLNTGPRTDYYYNLVSGEDSGIKLREGKIEYKHRVGASELNTLHHNCKGYFENWVKWSFNVDSPDTEQKGILGKEFSDIWTPVYKERVAIKIYNTDQGESLTVNLNQYLGEGCQMEYTRVIVWEQEWFTFGLEWFGNKQIPLHPKLLESVLGNVQLKKKYSMGYPHFLASKRPENYTENTSKSSDKKITKLILDLPDQSKPS